MGHGANRPKNCDEVASECLVFDDLKMLNQALKGVACGMRAGNGVTLSARPVELSGVVTTSQWNLGSLCSVVTDARGPVTIITASKFLAYVEGRVVHAGDGFSPERNPGAAERGLIQRELSLMAADVSEVDVVMLDHGFEPDEWVLGPLDPNGSAHRLRQAVFEACGVDCQVVISDSGSGPSKGQLLIGCSTFVATPIGATSGVSLPHAQRFATAAEIVFNSVRLSPFVVVEGEASRRRVASNVDTALLRLP